MIRMAAVCWVCCALGVLGVLNVLRWVLGAGCWVACTVWGVSVRYEGVVVCSIVAVQSVMTMRIARRSASVVRSV